MGFVKTGFRWRIPSVKAWSKSDPHAGRCDSRTLPAGLHNGTDVQSRGGFVSCLSVRNRHASVAHILLPIKAKEERPPCR